MKSVFVLLRTHPADLVDSDFSSGFSLIEIIITVFILAVLATTGYPKLMEYAQQIRTEQEARAIYEDLALTRQSAISFGTGQSTFNLVKLPTETFVSSYELKAPDDSNIRSVFMDQALPPPANSYRRDLKKRKVCITQLQNIPASTTSILTIHFDKNGFVSNVPANTQLSFRICQLIDDGVNPPVPMNSTGYEKWEILIDPPSATSTSKLILRRIP